DRRGQLENGAELVVDFGPRRVAVIVKTSREAIDSGDVQQAIALKERERCESSAIITNGRFTGAAQDFAPRNDCKLIGRDEFPDFVLGQIER
ncbi:MAG: restriction endonuclease, partial [Pirellulales bacterium]